MVFATGPASAKMPAPMIAPSPIAVSCHSPMLRSRDPSVVLSIGLRRKTPDGARSESWLMRLTLTSAGAARKPLGRAGPWERLAP